MRKFLVAAALLAVAACGDKPKAAEVTAPAMTAPADTGMKKDTSAMGGMKMDTGMKKDTGMAAPKKP